jgi:hypothetical protein
MMTEKFKSWLIARKLPRGRHYRPKSISNYLAECAWVEENCKIDLDVCYDSGQIASLLSRLSVGEKDLRLLIAGVPDTNFATYRSAVTRYREFREGAA